MDLNQTHIASRGLAGFIDFMILVAAYEIVSKWLSVGAFESSRFVQGLGIVCVIAVILSTISFILKGSVGKRIAGLQVKTKSNIRLFARSSMIYITAIVTILAIYQIRKESGGSIEFHSLADFINYIKIDDHIIGKLAFLCYLITFLDFSFMVFMPRNRALHDVIFDTQVSYRKSLSSVIVIDENSDETP